MAEGEEGEGKKGNRQEETSRGRRELKKDETGKEARTMG